MDARIQALLKAKAPTPQGMNPETQPTQPMNMALPSPVRPIRTSPGQVIFKSFKTSFGFFVGNDRVAFKNSYLMTADEKLIAFIKANYMPRSVQILEEGPLPQEEDKKD